MVIPLQEVGLSVTVQQNTCLISLWCWGIFNTIQQEKSDTNKNLFQRVTRSHLPRNGVYMNKLQRIDQVIKNELKKVPIEDPKEDRTHQTLG